MKDSQFIFARIGHMTLYRGPSAMDPRPIGGGGYNRTRRGHEINNFKPVEGKLRGYFQIPNPKKADFHSRQLNLTKIVRGFHGDRLDNVTVVFFAPHPDKKEQIIIGWYRNAIAFRDYQGKKRRYIVECAVEDAVLLPRNKRVPLFDRTTRKGRPGQSNVFYPLDAKGKPRQDRWIKDALTFVDGYRGANLIMDPEVDYVARIEEEEELQSLPEGQGRISSAAVRIAIEKHSMARAARHYRGLGYEVRDVSRLQSYDLECTRGRKTLLVEVKGTQSEGRKIFLTRNEVAIAQSRKYDMELFVLHSVHVSGKENAVKATGGQVTVHAPWRPADSQLDAVAYECRLDRRRAKRITRSAA